MTHDQAVKRAAEKTKQTGVEYRATRDAHRPGDWKAVSVASVRAAHARYSKTDKRRTTYAHYFASDKGRATKARVNLGRGVHGKLRLNRRGERFREADLLELRREQRRKCMVCGKPLKGTLRNGRKAEVVEHGHQDGFVRSLTHNHCNVLLAIIEKLKIPVHMLPIFITRVMAALYMPWISMTPSEIRRARARARHNRPQTKRARSRTTK